jgi:4-hydroxy-3-methylbut-2-enyl diphosphate reductase
MEIKLAKTAGFCMGVRKAVDKVLEIARTETGRRIYTYGPLIHNPQTIDLLKKRGIVAIKNIDDIPDKSRAVLVIRAHGIAPDERKKIRESGVKIVDATCPRVGYAQSIIKKHAGQNYSVLIVGDRNHPEVDGLMGFAKGRGMIISTPEEARDVPCLEKICVVAQTTQETEQYRKIVEIIQTKCPQALVFNTICSSTENRQEEIIDLAKEMDAVFVVGGKNSANTCRLADLSQRQNTPTFHIETADEIQDMNLSSYDKIGVSAGASTPNWIIDQVMDRIAEDHGDRKIGWIYKLWLWAVRTDFYSALGAGCLALACMTLQNIPPRATAIAIAAFFVYGMHVLNRVSTSQEMGLIGSFREQSYFRHEKYYRLAAVTSLTMSLAVSLYESLLSFIILAGISLAGILYNMKILPKILHFQRLKDIPGYKNLFMATAWGVVTAVLPDVNDQIINYSGMAIGFFFTISIVFIRSSLSYIMEMQSDKLMGRETIPVVFGKENTQTLLKVIILILLAVLVIAGMTDQSSRLSFLLTLCPLYLWICFRLCDRRSGLSGAVVEGLLETSYIIAGFAVLCWFALQAHFL